MFPVFSFYNFLGVECFPTQIVLMVCLLSEYFDMSCYNTENKTFNQLQSLNCKRKLLTSKIFSLLGYSVQLSSFYKTKISLNYQSFRYCMADCKSFAIIIFGKAKLFPQSLSWTFLCDNAGSISNWACIAKFLMTEKYQLVILVCSSAAIKPVKELILMMVSGGQWAIKTGRARSCKVFCRF